MIELYCILNLSEFVFGDSYHIHTLANKHNWEMLLSAFRDKEMTVEGFPVNVLKSHSW